MIALLAVLVFMLLVMTAGWLYQRQVRNGGWADVFWTYGTGAACVAIALLPFDAHAAPIWRQELLAALMAIWALRLGGYVAARVRGGAEDVRYAQLRGAWGAAFQRRMFALLIVQAPATALLCVSVLLAARCPDPRPRIADAVGFCLMVAAMIGESVADRQMRAFRSKRSNSADSAHEDRVCDSGLWGWSRHPNYFFEWLLWVALPVVAIQWSRPASVLSLAAPVVMFVLLRWVTGVPALEAAMLRTRGEAYRGYQSRVSAFLPLPPRR
jgi:steroid 5-alpha reductase family enzyme